MVSEEVEPSGNSWKIGDLSEVKVYAVGGIVRDLFR